MRHNFVFFEFLVKQVFSDLDFLGWYTVDDPLATEQDVKIQKQVKILINCSNDDIFLMFFS